MLRMVGRSFSQNRNELDIYMKNNIQQRIAGKAVIVHEGKVLIIRESSKYEDGTRAGRYDFPGGRVNAGESLHDALMRETKEECGLDIVIDSPIFVGEWSPTVKGIHLQIFGIFLECSVKDVNVTLSVDHDHYIWIDPSEYDRYDLVPPNKEVLQRLLDVEC